MGPLVSLRSLALLFILLFFSFFVSSSFAHSSTSLSHARRSLEHKRRPTTLYSKKDLTDVIGGVVSDLGDTVSDLGDALEGAGNTASSLGSAVTSAGSKYPPIPLFFFFLTAVQPQFVFPSFCLCLLISSGL